MINLSQDPEFEDIDGVHTRIATIGQGHSTEIGMPEIPHFTTYFQINPEREYAFKLEILDSKLLQ